MTKVKNKLKIINQKFFYVKYYTYLYIVMIVAIDITTENKVNNVSNFLKNIVRISKRLPIFTI